VSLARALADVDLAAAAATTRQSVDSSGAQANGNTFGPAITPNSRFLVFQSEATNLVAGDTNVRSDIFVRDRLTATTERVNVATGGAEANDLSLGGALSHDGRFVAFASFASNLVPGDTNGVSDVFLRDRVVGTTECVSVASGGVPGNGMSAVDRFAVSADGRWVVFFSVASDLVAGDANGKWDVFVRDRLTATTTRVSVNSGGVEGDGDSMRVAGITPDGRFVGFESFATNLVLGDTNGVRDAFLHDRTFGTTERISLATGGGEGNANSAWNAMTPDARWVVFESLATSLVAGDTNAASDVFVRDRTLATTVRVNLSTGGAQGNLQSGTASISDDGRFVAFMTFATNLVAPDTNGGEDVLLRDRTAGTTERASVDSALVQGNARSFHPAMSADGCRIAFVSNATNLVTGDTNGAYDAFLHDRECEGPQICGNGTVESPEECDEGVLNGSPGSCCSAACTLEPVTTVCRVSAGPCDPAEHCAGVSPTCPPNVLEPAGTACPDDGQPCTSDTCNGTSPVCVHAPVPDGTACSDLDSCTGGDVCIAGVCTFVTVDLECVNHHLCYRTRRTPGSAAFVPVMPVGLANAFEGGIFGVMRHRSLCTPVDKNNEGMVDPALHLNSYTLRHLAGAPPSPLLGLEMRDQFGTLTVDLRARERFLVPAHKTLGGPATPPAIGSADHLTCYRMRRVPGTPGLPPGLVVTARDQFQTLTLEIRKPRWLCLPTDKNGEGVVHPSTHLMCYSVGVLSAPHARVLGLINTADQFGPLRLDTVVPQELCLPSFRMP
jgi:cysteine-rich repeat protein